VSSSDLILSFTLSNNYIYVLNELLTAFEYNAILSLIEYLAFLNLELRLSVVLTKHVKSCNVAVE